jgi:hypothetical protein
MNSSRDVGSTIRSRELATSGVPFRSTRQYADWSMDWNTPCRNSHMVSSSKRSSVPKIIVFFWCRLNFTWNTAELPQLASAHSGIRILAFSESFGFATNTNMANHTNAVPKREGSDEAYIRTCLWVGATVSGALEVELPHMVPWLLWKAWRSTRSAHPYMLCLSVLMATVLPNLVFEVRRSSAIPVKKLGRYF